MTLIPLHTTLVTLPDLMLKDYKVGGNKALRFAFVAQRVEVTIFESECDGWYLLQTELQGPYSRLYLRKPAKRSPIPKNELCIELTKAYGLQDIGTKTPLRWIQH